MSILLDDIIDLSKHHLCYNGEQTTFTHTISDHHFTHTHNHTFTHTNTFTQTHRHTHTQIPIRLGGAVLSMHNGWSLAAAINVLSANCR